MHTIFLKHFLSFSFLHLAKKELCYFICARTHTERERGGFFSSSRLDSDYTAWNTGAKKKINSSCRFYERKIIGFFRRFKRSLKLKPLHSHTQCELRARYMYVFNTLTFKGKFILSTRHRLRDTNMHTHTYRDTQAYAYTYTPKKQTEFQSIKLVRTNPNVSNHYERFTLSIREHMLYILIENLCVSFKETPV